MWCASLRGPGCEHHLNQPYMARGLTRPEGVTFVDSDVHHVTTNIAEMRRATFGEQPTMENLENTVAGYRLARCTGAQKGDQILVLLQGCLLTNLCRHTCHPGTHKRQRLMQAFKGATAPQDPVSCDAAAAVLRMIGAHSTTSSQKAYRQLAMKEAVRRRW